MKYISKLKYIIPALILGIIIGSINFSKENLKIQKDEHSKHIFNKWTCSMHPQIRSEKTGKCPICEMDLIPVNSENLESPASIRLSHEAVRLANIQTYKLTYTDYQNKIYLNGKVTADEKKTLRITARFGGRIEKLYVNFKGQTVYKGQKLATIYSPQLISVQNELLQAISLKNTSSRVYKNAVEKLNLLGITERQISEIEKTGKSSNLIDIYSPMQGVITEKNVFEGDYIKEGSLMFQVIDLKKVWVMFDAYEKDLQWLKIGSKITFRINAIPGKQFTEKITFIDPVINPETRVAKARVELNNSNNIIKPEMYTEGIVETEIKNSEHSIIIPKTAILWTGKRSIVYVKQADTEIPVFSMREIILGAEAGNFYQVKKGLKINEEIAVNGVFRIDAAAQLAGKKSMMNSEINLYDFEISEVIKKEINKTIGIYISMKNSLIKADVHETKKFAEKIFLSFSSLKANINDEKTLKFFNTQKEIILLESKKIKNTDNIDKQRSSFKPLSLSFINILKNFGIQSKKYYIIHCPMADSNKGAYWISTENKVLNPYYGDLMLKCGSVKDSIY